MKKIIAGLAVLALGAGTAAAAGLDVTLSAPLAKSDYGSGKIAYALTNNSGATLHVLRWQTPLDGMTGRLFDVTRNGEKVEYVGPMVRRLPPTAADYVELKPGETLATQIDLTAYYDMKAGGQFEVRYVRDARDVVKEVAATAKAGVSAGYLDFDRKGAASIWVDAAVDALDEPGTSERFDGARFEADADASDSPEMSERPGDVRFDAEAGVLAATNTFKHCTATQKAEIKKARVVATNYATSAKNYVDAGKRGSRYTTWFGDYDQTIYGKVRNKVTKIHAKLSSKNMIFDCSCKEDHLAHVSGGGPEIFLCPSFWDLPLEGEYSKADTLVHETSHLRGAGNTDDSGPGWNNAYSYEGFALNAAGLD